MIALNKQFSYLSTWTKVVIMRYFESQLYFFQMKKINNVLKKNNSLVLVYSIGKVGSSTIHQSFKKNRKFNIPVFHIHFLSRNGIKEQKRYYKSSARKSTPFHLITSAALSEALQSYKGNIYLFTLIREPIKRELSSLFQDSFNFTFSNQTLASEIIQNKINLLIQNLPENKWLESELKTVFDFDVFSEEFDTHKGYTILSKENKRLAFVRLENLNKKFPEICNQLFEENYNFQLIEANNSEQKFYQDSYKKAEKSLSLSRIELDKIVSSAFIQKFYPDYITRIYEKWMEPDQA